jgi:hypothetical protein
MVWMTVTQEHSIVAASSRMDFRSFREQATAGALLEAMERRNAVRVPARPAARFPADLNKRSSKSVAA